MDLTDDERRHIRSASRMRDYADENQHEIPPDDAYVHWDSASCWCNPQFDEESGLIGERIVRHNRVRNRPV